LLAMQFMRERQCLSESFRIHFLTIL